MLGGYDGRGIDDSLRRFRPAATADDAWAVRGAAPSSPRDVGTDDSGSAVVGAALFVVGGIYSTVLGGVRNTSTMVSCALGERGGGDDDDNALTWSTKAPMPTARRGLAVAANATPDGGGGLLFAVGGIDCRDDCYGEAVAYLAIAERYDVGADAWAPLPPMPTARREPAAIAVGGARALGYDSPRSA